MYESPIEAIITEMQTQVMRQRENDIYRAVLGCDINVDKEELVKALQYDRGQYKKGYRDAVLEFAKYLKDNSFLCDSNDWFSFQAINVEDDLDDLVEDFLSEGINNGT